MHIPTLRISKKIRLQLILFKGRLFVWKYDKRVNNTYIRFIIIGIIYKHS